MDQILNTIGDTIGGFFDNPIVQLAIQALVVYFVILWLAAAYWAFRDMQQRSENPVLPYLAAALIILFTPGPVRVRDHRLPDHPAAREDRRGLRAQPGRGGAARRGRGDQDLPVLPRRVNDEWIICPTCRTQLNRVCANCGRLVGLDWALCAWCGRDFERADLAAYEPIATRCRTALDATSASTTAAPPIARAEPRAPRPPCRQPPSAGSERTGHDPGALTEPAAPDPAPIAPSRRARRRSASRAARVPALYLVGWVGSVMGLAVLLVSFLAPAARPRAWLFLAGAHRARLGLVVGARARRPSSAAAARSSPYRGPSPVLAFLAVDRHHAASRIVVVLAPLSALGLDAALAGRDRPSSCSITMLAYVGDRSGCSSSGPASLRGPRCASRRPDAAARPRPADRAPCSRCRCSS